MKNRDYKSSEEGGVLHIYNRGNNRERIFIDQEDYRAFMFRLSLALGIDEKTLKTNPLLSIPNSRIRIDSKKNQFKLHAFCLMPNHFHLLLEQCGTTEVSKFISQVCTSYAMYLNKKYQRVGHVFQERYKSVVIEDDAQLMWVSSYIHTNPVKDNLVKNPGDYKWSSYLDYIHKRSLPIINTDLILSLFGDKNFEKETFFLSKD